MALYPLDRQLLAFAHRFGRAGKPYERCLTGGTLRSVLDPELPKAARALRVLVRVDALPKSYVHC